MIQLITGYSCELLPSASDTEREKIYRSYYEPLLRTLLSHKDLKLNIHISGLLLEWLDKWHPEYIGVLKELQKNGRIELLGGSYYQSFLPLLATQDRTNHIEELTNYLSKKMNEKPYGCYLNKSIWDSSLIGNFSTAGIKYLFLEAKDFFTNSLEQQAVLTEENGRDIIFLPISNERYLSDEQLSPREFCNKLDKLDAADRDTNKLVCIMLSPLTENYSHKWLKELDEELKDRINIEAMLAKDYYKYKINNELAIHYLSSSTHWNLNKDSANPDSNFRNILMKNTEFRQLYGRLQYSYLLARQIRNDNQRRKDSFQNIGLGSFNQAYYPENADNILDFKTRLLAYQKLITSEKVSRGVDEFSSVVSHFDYDFDGLKELVYRTANYNMMLHLQGGSIFELDDLESCWNYASGLDINNVDTEKYKAGKLFLDSIYSHMNNTEYDFSSRQYQIQKNLKNKDEISYEYKAKILPEALRLKKTYNMLADSIKLSYSVNMPAAHGSLDSYILTSKLNLAVEDSNKIYCYSIDKEYIKLLSDHADLEGIKSIKIRDEQNSRIISLRFNLPINVRVKSLFQYNKNIKDRNRTSYFQGIAVELSTPLIFDWLYNSQQLDISLEIEELLSLDSKELYAKRADSSFGNQNTNA